MPGKNESWSDYAKRLAAGKLGLAAAYALSSQAPRNRKPKSTKRSERPSKAAPQPRKPSPKQAGAGLMRSKKRYEEAARISRGEY